MAKLINGMKVWVSNESEEDARRTKKVKRYVGLSHDGKHITEKLDHYMVTRWKYAIPVEEPKLVPWTLETVPMDLHWVRLKGKNWQSSAKSINPDGIFIDMGFSWQKMLEKYEWYNPKTEQWEPCGVMG